MRGFIGFTMLLIQKLKQEMINRTIWVYAVIA